MDESSVRAKLTRVLKDLNHVVITQTDAAKCPRCGKIIYPAPGRPDVLCDPEFVIEVKTLRPKEKSFPFRRIEPQQREWLNTFTQQHNRQAYIALGVIQGHGVFEMLDYFYLVPWQEWLNAEKLITPYQKSIPLRAGSGYKKELQENKLDIIHLLAPYEIKRVESNWILPKELRR